MYLRGRLTIRLSGALIDLRPPRNFFGGVANLLTRGSWSTREELETHKLLAFAQCANRALMQLGVKDVVRVSIDQEPVYEDLKEMADDFGAAMEALKKRLEEGFEPNPHAEFDLVLKHDDGVLRYVIDLDFVREHRPGVDPVAIQVTAVPCELGRQEGEEETAYRERISACFRNQESFDSALARWEAQLEGFLDHLGDHFRTVVGVDEVHVETRRVLPRFRDAGAMTGYTAFGGPLYGYDPSYDLAYFLLWDSLWDQYQFRVGNVYYGAPDWGYTYVGGSGWNYDTCQGFDTSQTAPVSAGGGSEWGGSDSGGGGWLSNIGDFASDSGGGGDIGSIGSDSGGGGDAGGSSCGSGCGSGGCGSG